MRDPKSGIHTWVPKHVLKAVMSVSTEGESFIDVISRYFAAETFIDPDDERPSFKRRYYKLDDLAVGATRTFEWRVDTEGEMLDQRPIHNAIRNYERKSGKQFKRINTPVGLTVQRVK